MNECLISTAQEVCSQGFRIKKPVDIDNKRICRVVHVGGQTIYLTTSSLRLLYKPSIDIYDNVSMVFKDDGEKSGVDGLKKLEDNIITRAGKLLAGRTRLSSIMEDMTSIRLRNKKQYISTFDSQGRVYTNMASLIPYSRVRILIRLDCLWANDGFCGINYSLVQMQVLDRVDAVPTACVFKNQDEDGKYEKYKKMLKMGIPTLAVAQKMRMDGEDERDILAYLKCSNTGNSGLGETKRVAPPPPPPPLPPPPPPMKLGAGAGCPPPFLKDIAGGNFKLKSIKVEDTQTDSRRKRVLGNVNKNIRVPTLDDIIQARERLKKPPKLYYSFELAKP